MWCGMLNSEKVSSYIIIINICIQTIQEVREEKDKDHAREMKFTEVVWEGVNMVTPILTHWWSETFFLQYT